MPFPPASARAGTALSQDVLPFDLHAGRAVEFRLGQAEAVPLPQEFHMVGEGTPCVGRQRRSVGVEAGIAAGETLAYHGVEIRPRPIMSSEVQPRPALVWKRRLACHDGPLSAPRYTCFHPLSIWARRAATLG